MDTSAIKNKCQDRNFFSQKLSSYETLLMSCCISTQSFSSVLCKDVSKFIKSIKSHTLYFELVRWIDESPFSRGFTIFQYIIVHVFITDPASQHPPCVHVSLIAQAYRCLLLSVSFFHLTPTPFLVTDAETYWFLSHLLFTGHLLSLSLTPCAAQGFHRVSEGGSMILPTGF